MEYPAPDPIPTPNDFNSSYFYDSNFNLDTAKKYFLLKTGGTVGLLNSTSYISSQIITSTQRIEVQNTNNTPITSISNCNDYGLHLHSVLSGSNGVYSGSSISFNNSLGENVPLAAIYLDKIAPSQGELVFACRNGATCNEAFRISSTGPVFTSISASTQVITPKAGTLTLTNFDLVANNISYIKFVPTIPEIQISQQMTSTGNLIINKNAELLRLRNPAFTNNFTIESLTSPANFFKVGTLSNSGIEFLTNTLTRMTLRNDGKISCGTNQSLGDKTFNILESNGAPEIRFGKQLGANNSAVLRWIHISDGNSGNSFQVDIAGTSGSLNLYANGNARFGGAVEFAGSSSITLGSGGTDIRQYSISTNTWSNLGIGPTAYNLSANFLSPIRANSVYSSSDKRLKNNIKDLEFDWDHYKKFRPKSFRWNKDNKQDLGLVAQDVLSIASEIVFPSENMDLKKESELDLDKHQWNLNYSGISIINMVIIKKMMDKIEQFEKKINELEKIIGCGS